MNKPSRFVQFGFSLIVILLTAGIVYADDGVYIDASVGRVSLDEFPGNLSIEDDATAYRVGMGYDFGNNIALEGSYLNWGEFNGVNSVSDFKGEVDGAVVSGLFKMPVTDTLWATARVGMFFWESEFSQPGFKDTVDGEDVFYGVGLRATLSPQLSVNGEWQRFEFGDDNADIIFVGASFKF